MTPYLKRGDILDKIDIDKQVKKEMVRLKRIYKDLDDKDMALVDGLIVQASRLRVSLDMLWDDLMINGDVELFSQSEKTEPYERERPAARLFNARDKNYQAIIKQLNEKLPPQTPTDQSEEILKFAFSGKK